MADAPTTEIDPPRMPRILGVHRAHFLYAVALLGSAVLLFEDTGFIIGPILLTLWTIVFYSRSRPNAIAIACALTFISICLIRVLFPWLEMPREASRRSTCKNQMKQIMVAMHNYHEQHDTFPPAYVADDNGRPMHSWRVLLLPFLDGQILYDEYRFDEPWDSEANRELQEKMPPYAYACPSHNSPHDTGYVTSYVAVVGPNACSPGRRGRTLNEIVDGTNKTVMIVETDSHSIPWTEPRDIDLSAAVRLLGSTDPDAIGTHQFKEFFFEYLPVRHVAFADGSVYSAPAGLDAEFARQVLTVDDGGPSDGPDKNPFASQPRRKLRSFNTFRFTLFAFFAVLPLPWVWLDPRRYKKRPAAAT